MTLPELASAVTLLEREALEHPLACWRAWHQPPPATSQRDALRDLAHVRTLIMLGGNRSGKTEALRVAVVALTLGSDHPDAAALWRSLGLDPAQFPATPGRGYMVALTSNDSLRYHRKQICALLPAGSWRGWNLNGRGEARVEIDCPGYPYPAEIWFKSEDQGEEGMQGDRCRVIGHDEEGLTSAVWREGGARLIDEDGWQLMSNTPLQGRTWVYHDLVEPWQRQALERHSVRWIHTAHNPYLPPGAAEQLAGKDPARARARTRGEFVVVAGLVWPAWDRQRHVIPRWTPLAEWPRFRGADVGVRAPTAVLWAAYATSSATLPDGRRIEDGTLVVYRLHYRAGATLTEHAIVQLEAEGQYTKAAALRRRTGDVSPDLPPDAPERIDLGWVDPSAAQARIEWLSAGLVYVPADNDIRAGISDVSEWLTPDGTGTPRILVTEDCHALITEIEGYVYQDQEAREAPVKRDDHACDALRYLVRGVRRWTGLR